MAVISQLKKKSKNLLPSLVKGVRLNFTTGAEMSDDNYASTDYIPLDFNNNSNYYLSGLISNLNSCVFAYNSEKVFLGRSSGQQRLNISLNNTSFTSGTAQGTGDIAFIRVSQYYIAGTNTGSLDDIDNAQTQLEVGTTATEYQPYYLDITKYNNSIISNITYQGIDYHFAKNTENIGGICDNAVNEPLIDMRIIGDSVQDLLPRNYQQVEYIESTGTQYIDTKIPVIADTKIETEIAILHCDVANNVGYEDVQIETQDYNLFGSYGNRTGLALGTYNGKLRWWNSAPQTQVFDYIEGQKYKIVLNDSGVYSVDGVEQTLTSTVVSPCPNSIHIFGAQHTGSVGSTLKSGAMRIYSFKIYSNNILQRNYVPCYKRSDNTIGLYDLVENIFYTNLGTDNFLKGNDIKSIATPETPIEIQSVGERTKNLFDILKAENGSIVTASGLNLESADRYRSDFIYLTKGTYTASIGGNIYSGGYFHKYSSPDVSTWLGTVPFSAMKTVNGRNERTATLDEDCFVRLVFLPIGNGTLVYEDLLNNKPQLEQGTTSTEYEPYGYKVPVNIQTDLYNSNTIVNDKYISSSGVETDSVRLFRTDYFNVVANTEYVLRFSTTATPNIVAFAWYDSNKTFISRSASETITGQNLEFKAVAPSNAKFAICNIIKDSTDISIIGFKETTNIYLNEPLRKVGDYADYIDYKNKKVVRCIKEEKLSRQNDWATYAYNQNGIVPFRLTIYTTAVKNYGHSICSHFPNKSGTIWVGNETGIYSDHPSGQQYYFNTNMTTLDEWKTWLDNNEVVLCFALETPTEETIDIPEISTSKGTNNFVVETTMQPSELKITYWKQIL